MYDCVVIGGGVAGVARALELAAAGARVAVVRAGPGASALSSGGWIGPLPALLARALANAGLPYSPCAAPLPHPTGELRRYDFAAPSHHAPGFDAQATVCAIAGLPAFHAPALARLWGCGASARVEVAGTPAGGWSPVALAAHLDRNPDVLVAALRPLTRAASALVLPAVLGMVSQSVHGTLETELGVRVVEALGVPPSVPGWRLDRALLGALAHAGIELIAGRVTGHEAADARLQAVHVQVPGSLRTVLGAAFVLATGRFVGGGVRAQALVEPVHVASGAALREATLVDPALGCAVWVDHLDQRFTTVQPVPLTDPVRAGAQPLLGAGVHVDAEGHPVDGHGRVHFANLVAAGSVIAASAPGLGHAASTGLAAGAT